MKPKFLDNPPRYTRTQREQADDVRYACAVEHTEPQGRNYSTGWWVAMLIVCVAALVAIVAQVPT